MALNNFLLVLLSCLVYTRINQIAGENYFQARRVIRVGVFVPEYLGSRNSFSDGSAASAVQPNTALVHQRAAPPAEYPANDVQQRAVVENPYEQPQQATRRQSAQGRQAQQQPEQTTQRRTAVVPAPAPRPAASTFTVQGSNPAAPAAGRPNLNAGPTRPPPQYSYMENFSSALFQPISRSAPQQNIIYSPSSVHAILGLIYGASSGETAAELQQAGRFNANKDAVALDFIRLLERQQNSANAQLLVASKLYYNHELGAINPDYKSFAVTNYKADIEAADFKRARTADKINAWVADSTGNRIRNLVARGDIDDKTEALLINVIYFKARWANEFSMADTAPAKFQMKNNEATQVNMMFNDDIFDYAELPDLNAKALELPYANTQISMLIILPNEVEGLAQLEQNLANRDLNAIAARLRRDTVTVRIPRFRIQFEQDLKQPLNQLNVRRMFQSNSEVDAMLMRPVKISKILQKATIDVNEAGSEASAATYAKFVPLSLPIKSKEFTADHPFVFAIRTPEAVLFIGHVVKPSLV